MLVVSINWWLQIRMDGVRFCPTLTKQKNDRRPRMVWIDPFMVLHRPHPPHKTFDFTLLRSLMYVCGEIMESKISKWLYYIQFFYKSYHFKKIKYWNNFLICFLIKIIFLKKNTEKWTHNSRNEYKKKGKMVFDI